MPGSVTLIITNKQVFVSDRISHNNTGDQDWAGNQSKRQTDIKAAAIDIEITYLDIELQTF